jgi:uncharacterized coiled-coil protein SlyX
VGKLLRILAASVGGGLVLGAGIRLGEAITARDSSGSAGNGHQFASKLSELEGRLSNVESEGIKTGTHAAGPGASADVTARLRGELREWLDQSVGARMVEVENRLRSESDRGQKQILEAFVDSVQTRVVQRISRLEDEFASQSAAMTELRECSLRTERSMQKLLGGLDRLIIAPAPRESERDSAFAESPEPGGIRSRL